MGLFTAYVAYKYGKKKARERIEQELEDELEICSNCGYARILHDEHLNCPN